jgi:4,5-DOPA dioxygenase extradiol
LDGERAWALGNSLAPLASDGVLIVGSGSLTHNLAEFRSGPDREERYVSAFSDWVREAVLCGDWTRLRQTLELAPHTKRAHPTPEHFWPLLVAAGAAAPASTATWIDGGITHSVLSMDSIVFGAN